MGDTGRHHMRGTILVIEREPSTADLLRDAGYDATAVPTPDLAADRIADEPPDVLVIDVRPITFNGLSLLRQPHRFPRLTTIVLTPRQDPFVEAEARRHDAICLVKPSDQRVLLALVAERVAAARRQRRWPRWPATGTLKAHVGRNQAVLLDVSYEGLRFQVPAAAAGDLSSPVHLRLDHDQLALSAHLVWTHPTRSGDVTCGAMLLQTDPTHMHAWRSMVDSVALNAG